MAISRNVRRQRSKVRKAIAEADRTNTAAFLAKQALIRSNSAELGREANKRGSGGISWLDPTRKPLGFTRRMMQGQLGRIGKAI